MSFKSFFAGMKFRQKGCLFIYYFEPVHLGQVFAFTIKNIEFLIFYIFGIYVCCTFEISDYNC